MSFGDILYLVAMFLFVFISFGIIKNYYRRKFDNKGRRIDMLEDEDKKEE